MSLVRYKSKSKYYPIKQIGRPLLWAYSVADRNRVRRAICGLIRRKGKQAMDWALDKASSSTSHKRKPSVPPPGHFNKGRRLNRHFYRMKAMANGPTHTTTRMIVRKTPREQRFW